ncbi:hypothetical protein BJV78DRAFT_1199107 [Lactifluus subvellereus]|nr:hypothetical protein BJV78DRAFT_1199107 [Lactifluus subvellereus]
MRNLKMMTRSLRNLFLHQRILAARSLPRQRCRISSTSSPRGMLQTCLRPTLAFASSSKRSAPQPLQIPRPLVWTGYARCSSVRENRKRARRSSKASAKCWQPRLDTPPRDPRKTTRSKWKVRRPRQQPHSHPHSHLLPSAPEGSLRSFLVVTR